MSLSYAICVPWRDNRDGVRARLWDYCEWRLKLSGIPYYVADDGREHGEPFNVSAARNRAVRQSTEDIVLIMDADHIVQRQAVDAVLGKLETLDLPWAPIFSSNGVFTFFQTEAILANELDPIEAIPELTERYCTSPLAIRRDVFEDVGGYNESYSGWGAEDAEFRSVLFTLHPIPAEANPVDNMNRCLFHQWAQEPVTWNSHLAVIHGYDAIHAQGPEAVRAYIEARKG